MIEDITQGHLDRGRPSQEILGLKKQEAEDFKRDSWVVLRGRENVGEYYEGKVVLLNSEPNEKLDDVKFSELPKAEIIEMSRNSEDASKYDISLRLINE